MGAEELRRHLELVVLHPVDVALQRIDLAIVGEHAEGLGEPPGRKGVGRVALMKYGERRDEALVLQIGIKIRELLGEEHALVDQRARRQRTDVEILDRGFPHALLDPPPAKIKPPLQRFHVEFVADVEHDLLDFGTGGVRFFADDRNVDRNLAPAIEIEAKAQDLGFDDGAAGFLRAVIGSRQEYLADADGPALELAAGALDMDAEEILRHLQMDAGSIARLAVRIDGAAVPHGLERFDGADDDFAARIAVDRRHQAHAAGIMLLVGRIGMRRGEFLRIGDVAGDLDFAVVPWRVVAHMHYSAASAVRATLPSR